MGHKVIKSHCDGNQKSYITLYDILKTGAANAFDKDGNFKYLDQLGKIDIKMHAMFRNYNNPQELKNIQVVDKSNCIGKNTQITDEGNTSKVEINFDTARHGCGKFAVEKLLTNPDSFKIMLNNDSKVDCKSQLPEHSKYVELEGYIGMSNTQYGNISNSTLGSGYNDSTYVYNCECTI